MTALPVSLADLEARMRAISEAFDKSTERKVKGPEFINFTKPDQYVIRVLPSRNYPNDLMWFRKIGRHFIKPEGTSGMLFACDYHTEGTPCPICKAVKTATGGPDGALKDVAIGKFGKGSAKSSAKYLINVVTSDRPDIVQTAEVPQSFIKSPAHLPGHGERAVLRSAARQFPGVRRGAGRQRLRQRVQDAQAAADSVLHGGGRGKGAPIPRC